MRMITSKTSKLAIEVARMGLPTLRMDDGSVELSIQEYSAKTRWLTRNYPADRVPAVGDEIQLANTDGTLADAFIVIEVRHLLVPQAKETIRAALLLVERAWQV